MLKRYQELPLGGVVVGGATLQLVKTGSWRSGERPVYSEKLCIHCLLCWVHCPEATIVVEHGQMRGFDYDHCKGCGLCAEHCPTNAIQMTSEVTPSPPERWRCNRFFRKMLHLQRSASPFQGEGGRRPGKSGKAGEL